MASFFSDVLRGLQTLVYPPLCIGCNRNFDTHLCQSCRIQWSGNPTTILRDPLHLMAVRHYDKNAQGVLLSAKEDGNRAAQELIGISLAHAISELLRLESVASSIIKNGFSQRITVVPMPSRRRVVQKRGEKFLIPITGYALCKLQLLTPKIEFAVVELLHHGRRVQEQSGLSLEQRRANMKEALTIDHRALRSWQESPVILIDDVITSGSTMINAYVALKRAKITVLGGVSACASKAHMPIR